MSNHEYDEKELEKREEKAYDEKSYEEKSYEEKSKQDPVSNIVWAITLIWAGVIFLANNLGFLESLRIRASDFPWEMPFDPEVWTVFFLGAGVIVLFGVVLRLVVPSYRRPVIGNLIWAGVLFGIALGEWELIWPLILVAIGASLLLGGIIQRR